MIDWLAMGGYAGYVWGSYGVAFAAIGIELWLLTQRKRRARARASAEWEARDGN